MLHLQNVAYTLILLGVLVFVHEFGHFLVAKALDVLRTAQRDHPEHFHLAANLGRSASRRGCATRSIASMRRSSF